ncbi:hypothetical protein NPIL_570471, partial [Nephila pilipes]
FKTLRCKILTKLLMNNEGANNINIAN